MPRIFADTSYYIALVVESDHLAEKALPLSADVAMSDIVTSDAGFVELLAYVAGRGRRAREAAIAFVERLRSERDLTIVRQTPELFDAGFELYKARPDKGYSLTDCMSMIICRQLDITEVATHDRHFAQAGFRTLL